jgi:hypothetical protein
VAFRILPRTERPAVVPEEPRQNLEEPLQGTVETHRDVHTERHPVYQGLDHTLITRGGSGGVWAQIGRVCFHL